MGIPPRLLVVVVVRQHFKLVALRLMPTESAVRCLSLGDSPLSLCT